MYMYCTYKTWVSQIINMKAVLNVILKIQVSGRLLVLIFQHTIIAVGGETNHKQIQVKTMLISSGAFQLCHNELFMS